MLFAADVHKEIVESWNSRDFKRYKELLHAEYSYTGGDGKEMKGPDAGVTIARMYAGAFPDGRLEIKRVFIQGNTAVAEMVGRGTHKGELMGVAPTHRRIEILICNVVELRDGKVYREREYMDMLTIMSQLGAVTLPGQAAGTA
jgi:steroid delta-isomerase-like uncharacterized protein